ncbi:MAG: hypothetical protein H7287_09035 [Thermoleophilia bacterium]|nr:hypothetical protein [Thermoleophilia bacterium]
MEVIEDTSEFDWLRPYFKGPKGMVADDVPEHFEAYCIVMHPLFRVPVDAIRSMDTSSLPERAQQLLAESASVSADFDEARAERVTWRTLCEQRGVTFEAGFTPAELGRWPDGYLTDEGTPGVEFTSALMSHVAPTTGDQECLFWYMCPPAEFGDNVREFYKGKLDDLPSLLQDFRSPYSPTYAWPSDRNWVVHCDYDSSYTVVAASKSVIASIEADDRLETLRLMPDTEWRLRPASAVKT